MTFTSFHVLSLLEQKGGYWLTSGRMGKYQAILSGNSTLKLHVTLALNPASLLPTVAADSSSSILLSQDRFGYSRFFVFPYKL